MRLDMSTQMKMDQRMTLAPRMIQSMEILQLPLLALQERIEQEMLSNPVLEMEEPQQEQSDSRESDTSSEETYEGEQSLLIEDNDSKKEDFKRLENIGEDYGDYLSRSSYIPSRKSSDGHDPKMEAMNNTAAPGQSLNDALHEQWSFIECDPALHKAGKVIIDYIEETGYLSVQLETLCEHVPGEKTGIDPLRQALKLVQTLEPAGVGARDLAECLLIQLEAKEDEYELEKQLVQHHLKDIEMNRYPVIAKKLDRPISDIKDAVQTISRLDPRPGLQIGSRNATYIAPDVIVEYNEQQDIYTAYLTDGNSPHLRINNLYSQMLKDRSLTAEAKEFLQNNMRSAKWLIDSIEQRKMTLMRVVNRVLETQKGFFQNGPMHLKPLPMVEVAEILGIHVGTVSRAVAGKYMQTPIGIFPLRYFFSGGMENASGQSLSWDAVKAKLQEIIDNEDKAKPYNDDELVKQLKEHGLTLARRTVAKYRGVLQIPPARRRKEYK